jgi:pimeloyl-ACP methyl ester carboxylesterase
VAHGSGSSTDFVRRALGPALTAAGFRLVAVDAASGDVDVVEGALAQALGPGPGGLVGGVSLGAHAAARLAAGRPDLAGALLVLPAWSGPPGPVAALSAAAAREVAGRGTAAVLDGLRGSGWVAEELAAAWPGYGQDALVRALGATAASAGPTPSQLAAIRVPTGIVAVAGDAFHPVEVARQWAGLVPGARLVELVAADIARDRAVIGAAAIGAWQQVSPGG